MASKELKKLNAYPEFRTVAGINAIIVYLQTGVLPPLNHRQTLAYLRKYNQTGFVVRMINNVATLFYHPNTIIDSEVCLPIVANQQAAIQGVYNDIQTGLGSGLSAFYHQVSLKYLNIKKALTDAFLRKHVDYAITRLPKKIVNRPIVTTTSNELWGIDLIDMSTYRGIGVHNFRYIMTVVDYYSGRLFARPLRNRENGGPNMANTIALNFDNIVQNEAGGFYPNSVICDNEFDSGGFLALCQQHNITLRASL